MKFKERLPVILKATCLGCAFAAVYLSVTPDNNKENEIENKIKQEMNAKFSMIRPIDASQYQADTTYIKAYNEHKRMMSEIDSVTLLRELDNEVAAEKHCDSAIR